MRITAIITAVLAFPATLAASDQAYVYCLKDFKVERATEFAKCTNKVFLGIWQHEKLPAYVMGKMHAADRLEWAERVEKGQMTVDEFNAADTRARSQILGKVQRYAAASPAAEAARRTTLKYVLHRNVKQLPGAPRPMHCHISSTGRWANCF